MGSPATPAVFKWPGNAIYIGLQVVEALLQRSARICVPSDEPRPLPGVASVHPVTLRPEVAVELLTADVITPVTHSIQLAFSSSADVITPVLCSDASPVHPVLKDLLLGA